MTTILVIDDDPQIALTIEVAEPSWTVIHAANGLEGLDLLRDRLKTHHTLDLIVLDIGMPGLDGQDTFIQIRTLTASIPVVIFTALVHDQELTRFMAEVGQVPIIYKGIPPALLAKQLRAALGCAPVVVEPTALLLRLQQKVADLELQERRQRAIRAALAVPARSAREGIRQVLEEAGIHVVIAAPSILIVRNALTSATVDVVITIGSEWQVAYTLTQEYSLPLLLLAISFEEGRRLFHTLQTASVAHNISIVVDNDLPLRTFQKVINDLIRGTVYHDPLLLTETQSGNLVSGDVLERLRTAVRDFNLTERDLTFLMLDLQDMPPESIAQTLGIKIDSVYTARSRICRKAEVASMFELRRRLRAQIEYHQTA